MRKGTSELYLGQDDFPPHATPEAELPKSEEQAKDDDTFVAGLTPTKTGRWVSDVLVKIETFTE